MINSMTGYGQAEGQLDDVTYVVEIRTVNNRYFKANIKLPEPVAFLEVDIDRLLRQSLSRGSVNYVLRLKEASANVLYDIDEVALRAYVEKLSRLACSFDRSFQIDVGGLLALPGILVPMSLDEDTARRVREKVLSISRQAIEQVKQMRAAEGEALAADLQSHCEAMRQGLERIRQYSSITLEQYQKKLKKRVLNLLSCLKLPCLRKN